MSYDPIRVSGAGTSVVNGLYEYFEIVNSKPQYKLSTYIYIVWADSKWNIVDEAGVGTAYLSSDDVATPDLCTTWSVEDGSTPVPTVTLAVAEGELGITLGNISIDANGSVFTPNEASLEITLSNFTLDGEGINLNKGLLEVTLDNIAFDANGEVEKADVYGELGVTLDNIIVNGNGYLYPYVPGQRTSVRVIVGDVTFEDEDIRTARVVEQIDPSSISMPASIFEVELYSEDADFNILEPVGDYVNFKYKTPVLVYVTINGTDVLMGQYYLDNWENLSNDLIRLSCIDLIALLEEMTAYGDVCIGEDTITADKLLERIIRTEYSEINYEINPALGETEIQGYLMNINSREALQKLCFVIGGYARSVRTAGILDIAQSDLIGLLTIGPSTGVPSTGQSRNWGRRWRPVQWGDFGVTTIPLTDQSLIQKIKLKPAVTKIEVAMHSFVKSTAAASEIFTGILSVGNHIIYFDKPYHTITVGGNGTLVGTKTIGTMAEVSVATEGEVTITGKNIEESTSVYEIDNLTPGAKDKTIRVDTVFMVTPDNGQNIAERLEDYYERRLVLEFSMYGKEISVGSSVLVETINSEWIDGVAEKLEIDLSAGFVSKVTVVGKVYEEEQ